MDVVRLAALLLLLAFGVASPAPLRAQTGDTAVRIDRAILVAARDPARAEDIAATVPPPDAVGMPIRLPHRLHRSDGNVQGVFWFRIDLPPRRALPAMPAVFIPRLTDGGTFYLNGTPVFSAPASDALKRVRWRRARAFVLPAHALREDGNVLTAKIVSRDFTFNFPHMLLGPAQEIATATERRQVLDQYGAQFTAVTAGVVGAFILCIWWQRRRERYYLLFGLCSLLWSLRTLIYGIEVVPAEIWWWLRAGYFLVIAAATATLAWFFLEFAGLRWRKWAWVVGLHAILGPVAVVASNGRLHEAVTTYWQGPLFLIVMVSLVRFAWWGYRNRSVEALIITSGVLLATVLAANDYATVSGLFARTRLYTLHLALPVLLITIGALLAIRFVRALRESEEANRVLAERLAEKERELAMHYERQRQLERRKASAAERQRIMQDMHDGLGAQLVSSLVMVERGGAQPEEIASLLRESLDEMRLAIDAFGQADIDLHGALASLRFRMQPRLQAAGIEMNWTMDHGFREAQPDERTAMQLLRIVQEALSNVIRHSGATEVSVRFEAGGDRFRITVADNGRGFQADAAGGLRRGHGLSGIRARAHDIGGEADIESSPAGTTVVVRCRLPRVVEAANDAA